MSGFHIEFPVNFSLTLTQAKLADPEVAGDSNEYQKVAKAAAELEESVEAYREVRRVLEDLSAAKSMLKESASEFMQT